MLQSHFGFYTLRISLLHFNSQSGNFLRDKLHHHKTVPFPLDSIAGFSGARPSSPSPAPPLRPSSLLEKKYDGSQTNNAESNNLKLIGICGEKACCGASSWLSRILQCACWRGGPSCSCHEHGDPQRSDHGTHGACGQETRSS